MPTMAPTSAEIMQAEAELCCHTIGYLKSTALHTAVKLGIPNIIHRHGGPASLSDLLAALLLLPPNRRPYLPRLMKVLAVAGIFTAEDVVPAAAGDTTAACVYRLNSVSRLLVDDDAAGIHGGGAGEGSRSLSPCVLVSTTPLYLLASLKFHQWLLSGEGDEAATPPPATPFAMAHGGETFYGAAGRDAGVNKLFNEAMGASSQLLAGLVVRQCGGVFAGVTSLVDVGGGDGTMARAIAEGFPHVMCSVLDLPQVVDGVSSSARDGMVEFVAGDMMEFIPPADVVLLKYVLHNWSDEDCVKILTRCREAITKGGRTGKVVVIDTVIGSPSQKILEAQVLMDMCMMMLLDGKEREEQNWHRIFKEAGFSHCKIQPILGMRSVIEVFP